MSLDFVLSPEVRVMKIFVTRYQELRYNSAHQIKLSVTPEIEWHISI